MTTTDWVWASIVVYCTVALGTAWHAFALKRASLFEPIGQYLVFVTLFTLPLPIRVCFTLEVEGDVTPHLLSLLPYIPVSVLMTATSLPLFSMAYYGSWAKRASALLPTPELRPTSTLIFPFIVIVMISAFLLSLLTREAGGLIPFLLVGYESTADTFGKGYLAIGFPWLFVASLFLLLRYARSRRKFDFILFALALVVIAAIQLVTGNRGMLMYIAICTAIFWHHAVRRIGWKVMLPGIALGFVALNLVGVLRGSNFGSSEEFFEKTGKSAESLSNRDGFARLFYTLTVGEFVVPIETFPQMVQVVGFSELPWAGASFLRAPLYVIPSAIFPDRPLPLTNWYMETFYGRGQPINEGRAFFFLSEGYLNFGPPGVMLVALFWGFFWGAIQRAMVRTRAEPSAVLLYSLMVGFMFRCIAGDFSTLLIGITEQSLVAAVLGLWLAGVAWSRVRVSQAISR